MFVPPSALYAAVPGVQHWTLVQLASNALVELYAWHALQLLFFLDFYVSCACMSSLCLLSVAQMHVSIFCLSSVCFCLAVPLAYVGRQPLWRLTLDAMPSSVQHPACFNCCFLLAFCFESAVLFALHVMHLSYCISASASHSYS